MKINDIDKEFKIDGLTFKIKKMKSLEFIKFSAFVCKKILSNKDTFQNTFNNQNNGIGIAISILGNFLESFDESETEEVIIKLLTNVYYCDGISELPITSNLIDTYISNPATLIELLKINIDFQLGYVMGKFNQKMTIKE